MKPASPEWTPSPKFKHISFWWLVDEAFRRIEERGIQCGLSRSIDRVGLPEVDLVRRHQTYAGMMMILVVPCE